MYITWLGQSCFKIQSRDTTLVTDPLEKESGLKTVRLANVNIIISSKPNGGFPRAGTDSLVINESGEYEAKGIFIQGIPISQGEEKKTLTVYWIEIEGMSVGHLGPLAFPLSDEQLEKLEGLDILFVPVGGHSVFNAKQAAQIISQIEPRIVIPMYYRLPNLKEKLDALDSFAKEMGIKSSEKVDRLRIQKKDLVEEEMKVIILQNQ